MPAITREELLAGLSEEELARDSKSLNRLLYEIAEKNKRLAKNQITLDEWTRYRDILRTLDERAAEEFRNAVWLYGGRWNAVGLGYIERDQVIDFAYELVAKYSEGAAEAACEFYDAMAELSNVNVPPAVPAPVPTIGEIAKTLIGVSKVSENMDMISQSMGRLVKQTGQDTTLQNAIRDGAQVAWIPSGDTCAFCLTLASRGWEPASKDTIKNGHAEHIHANCDCAYAVRFNNDFEVVGYNSKIYKRMYKNADGNTPQEKINSMRREFYKENKEKINEQKRSAEAKREEKNEPSAEEFDVN